MQNEVAVKQAAWLASAFAEIAELYADTQLLGASVFQIAIHEARDALALALQCKAYIWREKRRPAYRARVRAWRDGRNTNI
jgi:hypothetical protein